MEAICCTFQGQTERHITILIHTLDYRLSMLSYIADHYETLRYRFTPIFLWAGFTRHSFASSVGVLDMSVTPLRHVLVGHVAVRSRVGHRLDGRGSGRGTCTIARLRISSKSKKPWDDFLLTMDVRTVGIGQEESLE